MKKRFMSLLCVLVFALPFVAATPCFADTGKATIDQIAYQYDTETGKAAVIDANDSISGDVEIPGTIMVDGEEYTVTSIGYRAFFGLRSSIKITIPESVTSIGNSAFFSCFGLKEITISESVTSIGDHAFDGCSSLTEVTIPKSVISIGNSAFHDCASLNSVTISEGVTSIGDDAFYNCSSLEEITISEGVTSIGDGAFDNCSSLEEITIPNSVTSIGNGAFFYCTSLNSVTISEGVTSIEDAAFYNCSSLEEITIPDSVTSIGNSAFAYCSDLTDVYAQEDLILGDDSFQYVSQNMRVWRYEVLKSAEASDDGKAHVEIVSVKDKGGVIVTDSLKIAHDAMGDGYVIDKVEPDNLTLTHMLTKTEAAPATCTEFGNVDGWTCDVCGKHFKDENGITEIEESEWIIPATGHSYGDDGHCTACGAVDSGFAPEIISGANAAWHKGSGKDLPFASNASFADFLKVQVDGKDLDVSNYTVKEGSTIVTLNTSYLETLSVGKHALTIVSDTGTAETEFTIVAAEKQVANDESANDKAASDGDKESLAKTGDDSMLLIAILSILAAISIAAGALALRKSRI